MRRSFIMLSTVLLATACSEVSEPVGPQTVDGPALAQSGGAQLQEYIVVFHDNVTDADGLARGLVDAHGGSLGFVYETALKGFSAALPESAVTALESNPNVDYI